MSRPFSVALLGVGYMAEQHVRVLNAHPGFQCVSCASRSLDKAEKFAAAHGIANARVVDDVIARPQADAIWNALAFEAVAPRALEADSHGLPMFLEKPVGLDPAETMAARDSITSPHMVGLNRRFYEVIIEGQRILEAAGGIRAVEVHMPEDVAKLTAHTERTKDNWQFANSVHLVDLFRYFCGDVRDVRVFNDVRSRGDRSYMSVLAMENGARGIFQAHWFAPGGWRVALYGDDMSVVFQPIEEARVQRRGADAYLLESTRDKQYKAGLYGQTEAFWHLLKTGSLPASACDLRDYAKSVQLVDCLTKPDRWPEDENSE